MSQSKWKPWAVVAAILLSFVLLLKFIGLDYFVQKYGAGVWINFTQKTEKEKQGMRLPLAVGKDINLDDFYVKDRELHIEYVITSSPFTSDEVTEYSEYLHEQVIKSFQQDMCNNLMVKYFGLKVTYRYKYPLKTLSYTQSKTDCAI